MSAYAPPPEKPDNRIFASYPMPAKIDLIQERPRRESLVEQQLACKIGSQHRPAEIHDQPQLVAAGPRVAVSEQRIVIQSHQRPILSQNQNLNDADQLVSPTSRNQRDSFYHDATFANSNAIDTSFYSDPNLAPAGPKAQRQQQQGVSKVTETTTTTSTTTTSNRAGPSTSAANQTARNILNDCVKNNAANLAAELAEKEAKLMAEINALHQRPYSPYQTPNKIDLTRDQLRYQQQLENSPLLHQQQASSRSASRASSSGADLLDKEAKLLQEIEEIERKPYNPQTMVVEREQWFAYPEGRPGEKRLTDSKRRVKDFCSLPAHMYQSGQNRHLHEENLVVNQQQQLASPGSIHTTIIRSPKREIDNKSPLPFAFDNFTTKGVRGNIASVGAVEPERPRPPIYPIVKRSPTPNMARG